MSTLCNPSCTDEIDSGKQAKLRERKGVGLFSRTERAVGKGAQVEMKTTAEDSLTRGRRASVRFRAFDEPNRSLQPLQTSDDAPLCARTSEHDLRLSDEDNRLHRRSSSGMIIVDELDDENSPHVISTAASNRGSRSCMPSRRSSAMTRSTSRCNPLRRSLSRGGPVSRMTTNEVVTDVNVGRELRPESFHRFKRVPSLALSTGIANPIQARTKHMSIEENVAENSDIGDSQDEEDDKSIDSDDYGASLDNESDGKDESSLDFEDGNARGRT